MVQHEPIDPRDTVAEIENAEIEAEVERRLATLTRFEGQTTGAIAAEFGRVIIWCLEADSVAKVGLRVHVVAAKLNLDVGRGMSNAELAELMGFRRSAAHKLSKQFTALFGVKGPHDRSEKACENYREAWREANRPRSIRAEVPA